MLLDLLSKVMSASQTVTSHVNPVWVHQMLLHLAAPCNQLDQMLPKFLAPTTKP